MARSCSRRGGGDGCQVARARDAAARGALCMVTAVGGAVRAHPRALEHIQVCGGDDRPTDATALSALSALWAGPRMVARHHARWTTAAWLCEERPAGAARWERRARREIAARFGRLSL